jgi:hypothetical protein
MEINKMSHGVGELLFTFAYLSIFTGSMWIEVFAWWLYRMWSISGEQQGLGHTHR